MRRVLIGATGAIVAATLVAGLGSTPAAAAPKRSVVAAFYPIAYAAQQVGGTRVTVSNLTPAGAEPHDLELSPAQMDRLLDADAVFVMGRGFQPAVEKAAQQRDGVTVDVLDGLPRVTDPHVWLDPVLMQDIVRAVQRGLTKADPKGATTYARNADALVARLEALDATFRTGLATCTRDLIVTAHEAFGHLAHRYGLRQQGVAGIDPSAEPDAAPHRPAVRPGREGGRDRRVHRVVALLARCRHTGAGGRREDRNARPARGFVERSDRPRAPTTSASWTQICGSCKPRWGVPEIHHRGHYSAGFAAACSEVIVHPARRSNRTRMLDRPDLSWARRLVVVVTLLGLVAVACSSGDDANNASTTTVPGSDSTAATAAPTTTAGKNKIDVLPGMPPVTDPRQPLQRGRARQDQPRREGSRCRGSTCRTAPRTRCR